MEAREYKFPLMMKKTHHVSGKINERRPTSICSLLEGGKKTTIEH